MFAIVQNIQKTRNIIVDDKTLERNVLMKKLLTLLLVCCMIFGTLPVAAASGTKSYSAPYAGVYKVKSDAAVTVTTELGSVAALAAGGEGYVYLLQGANKISVNNTNAELTFSKLWIILIRLPLKPNPLFQGRRTPFLPN